jgi:hypothetical protein
MSTAVDLPVGEPVFVSLAVRHPDGTFPGFHGTLVSTTDRFVRVRNDDGDDRWFPLVSVLSIQRRSP